MLEAEAYGMPQHALKHVIAVAKKYSRSRAFGRRYRQAPDPALVDFVVEEMLSPLPAACADDKALRIGEWNLENCDEDKERFFSPIYARVLKKCHLFAACEVTNQALANIASQSGKSWLSFCAPENSRGQGLGIIIDSRRLQVLSTRVIQSIADVFHIPDLRPALLVNLLDTRFKVQFTVIVVHLKSMRGGPIFTAPVRRRQVDLLLAAIGQGQPGNACVRHLRVFNFWQNPVIGRALSDHGLTIYEVDFGDADGTKVITGDMNCRLELSCPNEVREPLERAGYKMVRYGHRQPPTQEMGPSALDGTFYDHADIDVDIQS